MTDEQRMTAILGSVVHRWWFVFYHEYHRDDEDDWDVEASKGRKLATMYSKGDQTETAEHDRLHIVVRLIRRMLFTHASTRSSFWLDI